MPLSAAEVAGPSTAVLGPEKGLRKVISPTVIRAEKGTRPTLMEIALQTARPFYHIGGRGTNMFTKVLAGVAGHLIMLV